MKRIASAFCALSMFAVISCNDTATDTSAKGDTTAATKVDTTAKIETAPPDSAAMMKAWMEYMTPGDMHKLLASQSGSWTYETTMWMTPGAPPEASKGKSVNKMILGGRYQQSTHSGSFQGQPFEGVSTLAYDNSKKKFVNTWVDNMGTGIMTMEGDYDPASKTLKLAGKMVDPTTGKECAVRQNVTFVDDKHYTMEMFTAPSGQQEFKTMEIKSTKQ